MRLIDADSLTENMSEAIDDAPLHIMAAVYQCIDLTPTIMQFSDEPLTLDELWGMDGEPVFIKQLEEAGHYYLDGGWSIVDEHLKNALDECAYGTAFLAYRHKPQEVKR